MVRIAIFLPPSPVCQYGSLKRSTIGILSSLDGQPPIRATPLSVPVNPVFIWLPKISLVLVRTFAQPATITT